MRQVTPAVVCLAALCWLAGIEPAAAEEVSKAPAPAPVQVQVSFERDVQTLFRRHCYRCHGPTKAEGGFRLSTRKAAFGEGDSGEPIIVAGKPDSSLLLKRLTDEDHGDLMPLDAEPLAKHEIERITRWIAAGAEWPDSAASDIHWAYRKPARPALPPVKNRLWARNAIDRFILARLEREDLAPSPPAERARLLRRASLALTGIPPTPAEVEAFTSDRRPGAYERAVDRLLASPHYGERWAQHWLDLARYADSNGFQADQLRDSWAYRDWVIRALNRDMPFDRFAIEQIAGDLIPGATVEQKVATGFHRTPTCNVEAGVHPEANRVNQVVDRVNTTGAVFLGTTLECAQCHDHKYDPFTQKEYYQLFAYFNNTPLEVKLSSGVQYNFYGPTMDLPLPEAKQQVADQLRKELEQIKERQQTMQRDQAADLARWAETTAAALKTNPARWRVLPITSMTTTGGEDVAYLPDGSALVTGSLPGTTLYTATFPGPLENINGLKIEALTHESLPGKGPGRGDAKRTNFILSELTAQVAPAAEEESRAIELHSPQADFSQQRWRVSKAIDGDRSTGWAIAPQFGKPHWASFRTARPISVRKGESLVIKLDQNYGRGRTLGRVRISVLTGDPATADLPAEVIAALKTDGDRRSKKQKKVLADYYAAANPQLKQLKQTAEKLERELAKIEPPSTLVMVELDKPRDTHVLNRGNYLDKGAKVSPGAPRALHPLDPKLPPNRLGFARWLMSKENPLVARVTVNRWWSQIMGRGLVSTEEDFGSQSEPPSHPELLDWLAIELMDSGWSMKHVHRQIVTSAAFRQSARARPEHLARDAENRLYSRGPRFRLPAETVRDNALAISGLLSHKMHGPPVMPYQPDGIWKAVGRNQPRWKTATDQDRYRRGVYVVWKRAAPYPSFVSFDAPDRAACTVKRPRTNTPLQALTLLNDPAYAEMALALAQRIMTEAPGRSPAARAAYGMKLCVARQPTEREVRALTRLYEHELHKVSGQTAVAKSRLANLLPGQRQAGLDEVELAAWFAVANVLLNLDETISQ